MTKTSFIYLGYYNEYDSNDQQFRISGSYTIPTTIRAPTPQRTEFYGAYAIASLLKALSIIARPQYSATVPTHIDNEGVVTNNQREHLHRGIKQHLVADCDLILAIREGSGDPPRSATLREESPILLHL